MPAIEQTIILLPCYSLEDFQVTRNDDEAEEILAGWCGLFHPAILHRTQMLPRWERAYDPPLAPDQALIVIPECSEKNLPSTWLADLPAGQAVVIRRFKNLEGLWKAIRQAVPDLLEGFPPELVDDFVAVGFAYLQVELMTRQLRYMSNLDEIRFRESLLKAAAAAVTGKSDESHEHLQKAFDLLTESREYFYPVQAHLIDLTLTAETTIGAGLRRELEAFDCVNLLTAGQVIRQMAEREPDTLKLLKSLIAEGKAVVLGGEERESPAALLPQPALLRSLRRGIAAWQEWLETRPPIYGKRRFGLTPLLPGILAHFRFEGFFHFALDDGKFPVGNQSKMRWEGIDGTAIDSVGRVPVDASRASTFLKLGETIGRMLDLDHAATVIFAHWPGQTSMWYSALRRVARFSPVLGSFSLATNYFRSTQYAGARVTYKPDEYRPPYLSQHVGESLPSPIGRWTRFVRANTRAEVLAFLALIRGLVTGKWDQLSRRLYEAAECLWAEADALVDRREGDLDARRVAEYDGLIAEAKASMEQLLPRAKGSGSARGVLWLNPLDVPTQAFVPGTQSVRGPVEGDVATPRPAVQVLPVPALGYAWAAYPGEGREEIKPKKQPWWARLLGKSRQEAEEKWELENENSRIVVDKTTGGIQGLFPRPYGRNLLAQRLGMRIGPGFAYGSAADDPEAEYSRMIVETIERIEEQAEEPAIRAEGRLVDRQGELVARFVQVVSAPVHLPFFRLRIHLEPQRIPEANPWQSYYACRFAWNDETATLRRSLGWAWVETSLERFESLYFNQLVGTHHAITLLCPGLPYHRVVGTRKLDTLLIVRGENLQDFELGIGLDLRYPLQAAFQLIQPPILLANHTARPDPASAWFVGLDVRNVVISGWWPVVEGDRLAGVRLTVTETEGRSGPVTIQVCRRLSAAHRVDGYGEIIEPLALTEDGAQLELGRFQTVEIELRFVS